MPARHPEQRHRLSERGQGSTAPTRYASALVSYAVSRIVTNHAEVSRFKAGIEAGRRRSTQRQTNGGAV